MIRPIGGTGRRRTVSTCAAMRRSALHSGMCLWTAASVLFGGCHPPPRATVKPAPAVHTSSPPPVSAPGPTGRTTVPIVDDPDGTGTLTATLSDAAVTSGNATITDLSPSDTQA